MDRIISKIVKIKTDKMPPLASCVEKEIEKKGIIPLRWAIVEVNEDELTISVSGKFC